MSQATLKTLIAGYRALSFMPGDWQTFERGYASEEPEFHVHFTAQEPVKAEFEVAFDNMLQDFTLSVDIQQPYQHGIAYGKGYFNRILHLRRKDTDEQKPVVIIDIDGVWI